MSKNDRFRFDPLSEEFSVVESLDFIGSSTLKEPPTLDERENDTYQEEKTEKKIYSYYLEKDVVSRLKRFARLTENTYSSIVNRAINDYVEGFGY